MRVLNAGQGVILHVGHEQVVGSSPRALLSHHPHQPSSSTARTTSSQTPPSTPSSQPKATPLFNGSEYWRIVVVLDELP